MKITFIVPELNLTGGLRVVSIYAQLLAQKGHRVTVVSPNKKLPSFKDKIKSVLKWKGYQFKSGFNRSFFNSNDYDLKILESHRAITEKDVPDADIIIATFWITAEWVANFSEKKGKKVYFIQHYEVHPWLPVERVAETLRLPFHQIVVSQWIADILKVEYHKKNIDLVGNAVDHRQFNVPVRAKNKITTFGFMYSSRAYKGSQLAINAFNKLKLLYPDVRLVAFGLEKETEGINLPDHIDYYCRPEQHTIPLIYSQCDAWLFVSSIEGFGLPILEAMACRTPVIGTRCGAAPELINTDNGFIVDIENEEALLDAMIEVCLMNDSVWQRMSLSTYNDALKHSWEQSASLIEKSIENL